MDYLVASGWCCPWFIYGDSVMLAAKLLSGVGEEEKLYVDSVFSTYLYTGNGSTQTINNGIDLAGKGGLVWIKSRTNPASWLGNTQVDTVRGATNVLQSDTTGPQSSVANTVNSFSASGFTAGSNLNQSGFNYVSWVFRRSPKFFDIVTYTGNGVAGRHIPHELGIAPGMVIVKCTSNASTAWVVYHQSLGATKYMLLSSTDAAFTGTVVWDDTVPTSSVFSVGTNFTVNENGYTYVAYLFAHDPSADGIIQCGSFTTDASGNATVNLGWEPQYLMVKTSATADSGWEIYDTSRGWNRTGTGGSQQLKANASTAESSATSQNDRFYPIATGFQTGAAQVTSSTYIYLAIRRPNKPPTTGTEVYNALVSAGTSINFLGSGLDINSNSSTAFDMFLSRAIRNGAGYATVVDRLRGIVSPSGISPYLNTTSTNAEMTGSLGSDAAVYSQANTAIVVSSGAGPLISHVFKRAPGFFDVVCYTGTGAARTVPHSLGVAPELMIVKVRNQARSWAVYTSARTFTETMHLDLTAASYAYTPTWNNTAPTSSVFTVGTYDRTNGVDYTYVAYLFASLPGISKVGSYTGNGTTQTINCGFATGARFILIKRTDSTGDWYVWDTARGIVSANDPHLSLNTSAAEVTTDDSVDPDVSGFIVNQVSATNINVSGGQYIFLSIA